MAEGGIKDASVPPAAITPAVSRFAYPLASMSGIATRENTALVAVDAPDTAAKPALANTVDTAKPPGTHPNQRRAASNSLPVKPAWKARKPIRMKRGSTESGYVTVLECGIVPAMAPATSQPSRTNKPRKPTTAAAIYTRTPITTNAINSATPKIPIQNASTVMLYFGVVSDSSPPLARRISSAAISSGRFNAGIPSCGNVGLISSRRYPTN